MTARHPRATRAAVDELLRELPHAASTDPEVLASLQADTSRASPDGMPAVAVTARCTADVQAALRWASRRRVAVSVRGAGTGVSGGAVAYAGGLVLSTAGMNEHLVVDPANRLAEVDPGVIVAAVDRAAAVHGLMYAPDPVSVDIATIGGTVATNAGGLRCLAHGVTRDAIAGLEVVLADGRVIHTGSRTRKNSTGYDLTGLFVGSEGSLGVVTRVLARLQPRPLGEPVNVQAGFDSLAAAGAAVTSIMASPTTPEVLELMDRRSVDLVHRFFPDMARPAGEAVLVGQTVGLDAAAQAQAVAAACLAAGATWAEAGGDDALLHTRRRVNPALNAAGLALSCDVAVAPSRLAEMFARIEAIAQASGLDVSTCAHAGDGNLHPSVVAASEHEVAAAEEALTRITEAALKLGGVISGEHGLGSLKTHLLGQQFDAESLALQRQVKHLFDPLGILSPGRVI